MKALRHCCQNHDITFHEQPQMLSPCGQAWFITDDSGRQWVAKRNSGQDEVVELLNNFSMLHPDFLFPQPASGSNGPYWIYPYLEGENLAERLFEDPGIVNQVIELIGRLQAVFRSLILVPFYSEALKLKESAEVLEYQIGRMDMNQVRRMDDRQKAVRQKQIVQSHRWTENRLDVCGKYLEARTHWPGSLLADYRSKLHNRFSLHLPITGNNLAHTALHAEHLLMCAAGKLGVVGWHIAPRPRFYMMYTYLAWSFINSKQTNVIDYYRGYLVRNSSKAFYHEHHLAFALCLMDQLTEALQADDRATGTTEEPKSARDRPLAATRRRRPSAIRQQEIMALFQECVENS